MDRARTTLADFCSWLGNLLLDAAVKLEGDYEFAAVDWTDRPDVSRPPFLPDVEPVEQTR